MAAARVVELGTKPPGHHISHRTLRHSCARHLLMHGILINYLSRWVGHSSIDCEDLWGSSLPEWA